MEELGWIRVYRKLRQHWLWPKDRRYTNLEAWMDLILSANHRPQVVPLGFQTIAVERGQCLTSQLKLAKKWGWHRETVSKFLTLLKTDNMIDTRTSNQTSTGYTLITIRNYGTYQDSSEGQTDSQADTEAAKKPALGRHSGGTNNNEKNEKKRKSNRHSISSDLQAAVIRIVTKINELAGTAYESDSKIVLNGLVQRLLKGASEQDCMAVLNDRWHAWKNTELRQHFNPETLFRETNFDKYLNASRMGINGNGASRSTDQPRGLQEIPVS